MAMNLLTTLPLDVKLEIFDRLSLNDLGQIVSMSKDGQRILSQERSQTLIAKKIKEEQQKCVDEVEPILSTIISYGIKNLTSYVRFNYRCDQSEIVFLEIREAEHYPLKESFNANGDEMTDEQIQTAHKYLDCIINGNISVHTWVNSHFIRHVTKLVITNDHGVNDDSRSHRGDCLYDAQDQETIRRKAFRGNDDEDEDDDDDEYRTLDYKYYNKKWETCNTEGVTWGDIMEGVMNVKGSKSDFWYELICEATAKIVDNTLYIELDMDFGS